MISKHVPFDVSKILKNTTCKRLDNYIEKKSKKKIEINLL